jgi:hypothetical protein
LGRALPPAERREAKDQTLAMLGVSSFVFAKNSQGRDQAIQSNWPPRRAGGVPR